jgi:hypothetical protein
MMIGLFWYRALVLAGAAALGMGGLPAICCAAVGDASGPGDHPPACCLTEHAPTPVPPSDPLPIEHHCPPGGLCGLCPAVRAVAPDQRPRLVVFESLASPAISRVVADQAAPRVAPADPAAAQRPVPLRSLVALHCQLTC